MMICREDEVEIFHLPPAVLHGKPLDAQPVPSVSASANRNLVEAVESFERAMIFAALEKCDWNKTQAARQLGVTHPTRSPLSASTNPQPIKCDVGKV